MALAVGNDEPGLLLGGSSGSYGSRGGEGVSSPRQSESLKRFEIFYLEEYGSVVQFANLKMASFHAAEDLAMEAFLITYSKWGRLDAWLSEPGGWLRIKNYILGVVRNLVSDFYRRPQVREHEVVIDAEELEGFADESCDSFVDLLDVVRSALGKLPEKQLRVLLMGIEGYSISEIADELAIAESTARTHLALARRFLRKLLCSAIAEQGEFQG